MKKILIDVIGFCVALTIIGTGVCGLMWYDGYLGPPRIEQDVNVDSYLNGTCEIMTRVKYRGNTEWFAYHQHVMPSKVRDIKETDRMTAEYYVGLLRESNDYIKDFGCKCD